MRYALTIHTEPGAEHTVSDEERAALYAEYFALLDDERVVTAARLYPAGTAARVRVSGGRTLMTDGPFADTKEVLGGFCVIEAADLADAVAFAARVPSTRLGGAVEIRPVTPN